VSGRIAEGRRIPLAFPVVSGYSPGAWAAVAAAMPRDSPGIATMAETSFGR
jgi:hypothetical protein